MLRGASFFIAVTISTAAAVPVALLSFTALDAVAGHHAFADLEPAYPRAFLLFALQRWWVGAMIAILPVAFGTAAMALLGIRFGWARSWVAWGAAGAIPTAVLSLLTDPSFIAPPQIALTAIVTGIGCALISRMFIRWKAPAPQV